MEIMFPFYLSKEHKHYILIMQYNALYNMYIQAHTAYIQCILPVLQYVRVYLRIYYTCRCIVSNDP